MNRAAILLLALICTTACETPVTSTFVDGTVAGVSIPGATAVSTIDKDILGGTRRTVWIGTNLQCSDLAKPDPMIELGASPKILPDGGRAQLLIVVQNGNSFLDTGNGRERITGTTDRYLLQDQDNTGRLTGRFISSFPALPDGGGAQPDGGTFSGDFIAPPCASARAGCEVTPVGTFSVLGLILLGLRKLRRRR